jgi:hypothetical protein
VATSPQFPKVSEALVVFTELVFSVLSAVQAGQGLAWVSARLTFTFSRYLNSFAIADALELMAGFTFFPAAADQQLF